MYKGLRVEVLHIFGGDAANRAQKWLNISSGRTRRACCSFFINKVSVIRNLFTDTYIVGGDGT